MIKEEREINEEATRRVEIYLSRNLGEEITEEEYDSLIKEMRDKIQDEQSYWKCT